MSCKKNDMLFFTCSGILAEQAQRHGGTVCAGERYIAAGGDSTSSKIMAGTVVMDTGSGIAIAAYTTGAAIFKIFRQNGSTKPCTPTQPASPLSQNLMICRRYWKNLA